MYFTPLPPHTLDGMSAGKQQSYRNSVSRLALTHDTLLRHEGTRSAGLRGVYVTPMPPPSPPTTTATTTRSRQVAATEQPSTCRAQQMGSGLDDGACNERQQAAELQGCGGSTREGEDAEVSQQGSESLQATEVQQPRKKRRGNNKNRRRKNSSRRRKASQQAAIADDDEHGALDAVQHS